MAAAESLDHRASAKPKTKSSQQEELKSGPMASDVIDILKRNEGTLVSMALHYSGGGSESGSVRKSYYALLDVMPAMSISMSMDGITEEDEGRTKSHEAKTPSFRRAFTMAESPTKDDKDTASPVRSPPKRAMTSPFDDAPDVIENYSGFVPGKVQPVSTFRGALTERDNKKKQAVELTIESLWKLLNDFGVCPDHCR
jgi:hypothetical protein